MMFVENHKERINITVDMVLRIQKHSEGMLVNGRIYWDWRCHKSSQDKHILVECFYLLYYAPQQLFLVVELMFTSVWVTKATLGKRLEDVQ